MQSLPADQARSRQPALTHLGDEVCATIARLFAYVGTLALIAILAVHGCDRLQIMLSESGLPDSSFATGNFTRQASGSYSSIKSNNYSIFQAPRWAGSGGKTLARLELNNPMRAASTDFATRTTETAPPKAAGATLKQGGYAGEHTSAASADWMSGVEKPQLRGTL